MVKLECGGKVLVNNMQARYPLAHIWRTGELYESVQCSFEGYQSLYSEDGLK